jgi:hypothetical protein
MAAVDRAIELDELVERWTLLDDERDLLAGNGGAGKLGFAVLMKFYGQHWASLSPSSAGSNLSYVSVESVTRSLPLSLGQPELWLNTRVRGAAHQRLDRRQGA